MIWRWVGSACIIIWFKFWNSKFKFLCPSICCFWRIVTTCDFGWKKQVFEQKLTGKNRTIFSLFHICCHGYPNAGADTLNRENIIWKFEHSIFRTFGYLIIRASDDLNIKTIEHSNFRMLKCSNNRIIDCSNVRIFKSSHVRMSKYSIVPLCELIISKIVKSFKRWKKELSEIIDVVFSRDKVWWIYVT